MRLVTARPIVVSWSTCSPDTVKRFRCTPTRLFSSLLICQDSVQALPVPRRQRCMTSPASAAETAFGVIARSVIVPLSSGVQAMEMRIPIQGGIRLPWSERFRSEGQESNVICSPVKPQVHSGYGIGNPVICRRLDAVCDPITIWHPWLLGSAAA